MAKSMLLCARGPPGIWVLQVPIELKNFAVRICLDREIPHAIPSLLVTTSSIPLSKRKKRRRPRRRRKANESASATQTPADDDVDSCSPDTWASHRGG